MVWSFAGWILSFDTWNTIRVTQLVYSHWLILSHCLILILQMEHTAWDYRVKDKTHTSWPQYKLLCYIVLHWSPNFRVLGESKGWINTRHRMYLGIWVSDPRWPAPISSLISWHLLTAIQCFHHAKMTASRPCHALLCLSMFAYAVPPSEKALLYLATLQGPIQASLFL